MATDTVNQAPLTGSRADVANLNQARELVDFLVEQVQELYMHSPSASGSANTLANALLSGVGHAFDRAISNVGAREASICEGLALLGALEDMLLLPSENEALWQRATGIVSGIRVALGHPVEGDAEAAQTTDSAQPPSAGRIAAPAPVSQAVEPVGNGTAGVLWQMAMDEACNTNVHDADEGLTNVIALLDALKPYLMGAPDHGSATVEGGAAQVDDMGERAALACKAACEAHSLAALVGKAIEDEEDNEGTRDAMHSMLLRIQRLSCCVLSALDDDVATIDNVREQMSAA